MHRWWKQLPFEGYHTPTHGRNLCIFREVDRGVTYVPIPSYTARMAPGAEPSFVGRTCVGTLFTANASMKGPGPDHAKASRAADQFKPTGIPEVCVDELRTGRTRRVSGRQRTPGLKEGMQRGEIGRWWSPLVLPRTDPLRSSSALSLAPHPPV
jgi:hypothetical protein